MPTRHRPPSGTPENEISSGVTVSQLVTKSSWPDRVMNPRQGGITVESAANGGMKSTFDGTTSEGKPFHTEVVGAFDGKDNPVKGAQFPNTTAAYKRIDSRTFESMTKIDGKPTTTSRIVISADGKTLTATTTGKNVKGETLNNVVVADKQ